MSEPQQPDPSANTQAFQAFVKREAANQPEVAAARSSMPIVGGIIAAVIVVAAAVWFFVAH